jgi:ribosome-associated protein
LSSEKNKEKARDFIMKAARIASDRHCSDIVAMDLKGMSPATDYFLIATGTSNRQTRAVAEEIIAEGKKNDFMPFGRAGFETGNWILVDFVDVVVHLFDPEAREYYDLELLWGDAEKLKLEDFDRHTDDETSNSNT